MFDFEYLIIICIGFFYICDEFFLFGCFLFCVFFIVWRRSRRVRATLRFGLIC